MSSEKARRWPHVQFWRDPARPDLGMRFGLDFENPTVGFPEVETYVPESEVSALRAEWEEELLSDRALKPAADCFYPDIWPGDETEMTDAEKASTTKVMLEQALAAIKEERNRG